MRVRRSSLGWCLVLLASLTAAASAAPRRAVHEFVGTEGPAFMRNQLPKLASRGARQAVAPTADLNITQSDSENVDPTWSPDGTQVAFSSNRAGSYDIYICRADGSNPDTGAPFTPKLVSSVAGDERSPAWSPGGTDLAYLRGNAIYVRNLRTMLEIRLIDQLTNIQGLSYSPDGGRLVFSARLAGDADLNLYWVATDPQTVDPATGQPQMVKITDAVGNEINPCWFPNSDANDSRQLAFASNALGDYDVFRVSPPAVGSPTVAITAASRVIGTGSDGDQTWPAWVANYSPTALEKYYLLYADNAGGDYDIKVYNTDRAATPGVVYQGLGDQIQPVGNPVQDATHNACVYSGKKTGVTKSQLFVIDIYDNSPPILSDGLVTRLPQVTPQRAFGGSTVTISARIFDKGSGVSPAPVDSNNDGFMDSGVWALIRVADLPVYARWNRAGGLIVGDNTHWSTDNQIEVDQQLVDVPSTTAGSLVTVDPTEPGALNVSGFGVQSFSRDDAMAFVDAYGLKMYDDGTHGDATAGDGMWSATWVCPSETHDFYVDIVPSDQRGNLPLDADLGRSPNGGFNPLSATFSEPDPLAIPGGAPRLRPYAIGYDHIAGFTTRQLDATRRILFVSDYGCGQKFQAADFMATDSAALNRYWPVVLPTEHYWFSGDDVAGDDNPTAHPLFEICQSPAQALNGVIRPDWGGRQVTWTDLTPSPFPQSSLPTQMRTCSSFTFEDPLSGGAAPFGGPDNVDRLAVWRILSRGPVDAGTLGYYTPMPLPAVEGSPMARTLDADGMVIWASPYCGGVFAQPGTLLDAATQGALRSFAAAGGSLLATGQDIAWALTRNGSQMSPFLQDVLKATFVSDAPQNVVENLIYGTYPGDRNTLTAVDAAVAPEPALFQYAQGNPIHRSLSLHIWGLGHQAVPDTLEPLRINGGQNSTGLAGFGGDGCPNAWFIDDIQPAGGGQATYNYAVNGATAMVRSIDTTTGARVVYCAFGMESVRNDFAYCAHGNEHYLCGMEHRFKMLTNISDYLRTGGLRGKVVSTDATTPMAGITVIARKGTGSNGQIMGRTTSLSDGTYLIEGLSAGDYALFVVSNEYTADHRPVQRVFGGQISANPDLNMRLLRFETAALFGTVTDPANQPVAGATVTAQLATTGSNPLIVTGTTNTDGQYSISVPSGTYTLTGSATGFASTTITDVVVVAGQDQRQDIRLQSAPGILTGHITGSNGGVGGATVVAASAGVTVGSTTTDANGLYTMSIAGGTYDLVVTAVGYQQGRKAGIVVTSNASTQADLTLSPVAPGSISGNVTVQGSNQAVAGVTVSLLAGGAVLRTAVSAGTITTQGGISYNWRLDDVPAGVYDVRTQAQGYAPQTLTSITVQSNQMTSGVDFTLQPLHVFIADLSMASTPFDYTTSVPDAQNLIDDDNNLATPLKMAAYNTAAGAYAYYPNQPARTFALGRGYFLKLARTAALTREGVRAATTGSGYDVPLLNGWNLIGAVYEFPVDLFACQVVMDVAGSGSVVYSFQEAVSRGLVGGSLYTLNFGVYQQTYRFDPYTGYWLRAFVTTAGTNLKLRVPPTPLGGSRSTRTRSAATNSDWQATLVARTTDGRSAQATFGSGSGSANVYDGKDRAQPPAPPVAVSGWLELVFPHGDWGRYSGAYMTDIRSTSRQMRWELELRSAKAGEMVSLSWPELGASVPGGLRVILEDLQTGVRRSLRHTTGYTLRSDGNARRLAIIVEPADNRPAVSGLGYTPTRGIGGEVRFTLSADLTTNAIVRGLNGAIVRTLLRDQLLTAGPQSVVWDGQDDAGRTAPDGTYRLEVIAVSDTGEQVRATTTVLQRR